jgi:hypothetical protein
MPRHVSSLAISCHAEVPIPQDPLQRLPRLARLRPRIITQEPCTSTHVAYKRAQCQGEHSGGHPSQAWLAAQRAGSRDLGITASASSACTFQSLSSRGLAVHLETQPNHRLPAQHARLCSPVQTNLNVLCRALSNPIHGPERSRMPAASGVSICSRLLWALKYGPLSRGRGRARSRRRAAGGRRRCGRH